MAKVVHWVKWFPVSKPAEVRGFWCGAPFDPKWASSYLDQVNCEACRRACPTTKARLRK